MQLSKSLLIKILSVLCVICCAFALVFGVSACSDGKDGEPGPAGPQGEQGLPGQDGEDGKDGADGKTPYIGENGNWWIGDTDTGVPAAGKDGENGSNGQDGQTPYIGENGNWWIGNTDTGYKAVGQDGENGANGENGLNGIGFKDAYIDDDGNLILVRDDDTKVNAGQIVVPETPDTHVHTFTEYTLQTADCDTKTDGYDLKVCNDCGWSQMVVTEWENTHHNENTVHAPTCTEEGYTVVECSICGYVASERTDIVPATGHTLGSYVDGVFKADAIAPVKVEGENFCLDGGMYVQVCGVCGETVYNYTEAAPGHHTVEEYHQITAPTYESTGKLVGMCTVCSESQTIILPELDNTHYAVSGELDCEVPSELTYVYTVEETGQTFTYTATQSATGHTLNGVIQPDPSTYVYSVDYKGIKLFVNVEHTCEDEGFDAYYICEVCNEAVIVKAEVPHTKPTDEEAINVDTAATCTTAGQLSWNCTVCGALQTEVIPALGHNFEYTLSVVAGVATLTGDCTRCDVTDGPITVPADKVKVEITPAACGETGKKVYTVEGYDPIEEIIPAPGHTLNGVAQGTTALYPVDTENLKLFTNVTLTCSDTGAPAYYICEVCGEPVYVMAYVPHTAPEVEANTVVDDIDAENKTYDLGDTSAAALEEGKIYVQNATCTEKGLKAWYCTVCGDLQTEEIKALGHSKVYADPVLVDNEEDPNNGKYVINVTCDNGCGHTETIVCDTVSELKVDKPATCEEAGYGHYDYTYTVDTETRKGQIKNVPIAKLAHALKVVNNEAVRLLENDTEHLYSTVQYPEIKTFVNVPACDSGESYGTGYFICVDCGASVLVYVAPIHTAPATTTNVTEVPVEAESTSGVTYIYQASCDVDAVRYYFCEKCHNWVAAETLSGTAGTHTYTYEVTTEPTEEAAGSITVTCTKGDVEAIVLDVPALTVTNYPVKTAETTGSYSEVIAEATCKSAGLVKYTYVNATYKITETFTVETPIVAHNFKAETFEYVNPDTGIAYRGQICKVCGQMVAEPVMDYFSLTVDITERVIIPETDSNGNDIETYNYWAALDGLEIGTAYCINLYTFAGLSENDVTVLLVANGAEGVREVEIVDKKVVDGTLVVNIFGEYPDIREAGVRGFGVKIITKGVTGVLYVTVSEQIQPFGVGANVIEVTNVYDGVNKTLVVTETGSYTITIEEGADAEVTIVTSGWTKQSDGSVTYDGEGYYSPDKLHAGDSITLNLTAGDEIVFNFLPEDWDSTSATYTVTITKA